MADETQAIAVRQVGSVLPSQAEWETQKSIARGLFESGILGRHITNPWAALAIIEKGRELGIAPMTALSHINMIEGKPSADAQMLAGMIYTAHGDNALEVIEETDDHVTIAYKRKGWAKPRTTSFTMEDARRAGLTNKQNWQKYPKAMLTARAISKAAHMAFQDVVAGMYTPEELAPDRVVMQPNGQMEIIDIPATNVPAKTDTPIETVEGTLVDMTVEDEFVVPDTSAPQETPSELLPPDYDGNDPADVRQRLEVRCEQLAEYASLIGHEQSLQINGVDVGRLSAERLYEWTKKLEEMFDCVSATAVAPQQAS
jgi:hypothetical protein